MIKFIPKLFVLMVVFFSIAGISTFFTVSYFIRHEETVVVPNLVGEDIIYVLELLTGFGLNAKVRGSEYSSDFSKNIIIFQDPEPGEIIKKGRDVRIIISKGTKTLPMPNITGLDLQQALLILDKNGLFEGSSSKTYHHHVRKGKIVAQYPLPGRDIERGISSNLLISKGIMPSEFMMPDLCGLYLDQAVLAAEKNHLVIDRIKTVYQKNKPSNTVLKQEPPAGFCVQAHDLIHLELNRLPGGNKMNDSVRDGGKNGLFRYRIPAGFLKQHIRLELRAFETTFTLYDELMKPGREIWIVVPAYTVSVIFIYKNDDLIMSRIFN